MLAVARLAVPVVRLPARVGGARRVGARVLVVLAVARLAVVPVVRGEELD